MGSYVDTLFSHILINAYLTFYLTIAGTGAGGSAGGGGGAVHAAAVAPGGPTSGCRRRRGPDVYSRGQLCAWRVPAQGAFPLSAGHTHPATSQASQIENDFEQRTSWSDG